MKLAINEPAETIAKNLNSISFFGRNLSFLFVLVAVLSVLLQTIAIADTGRWMPYPPGIGGPWGGKVRKILSPDPLGSIMWAAAAGGVFFSSDGGKKWEARNNGLPNLDIISLSAAGDRLLAFIEYPQEYRGLYQSDSSGLQWEAAPVWRLDGGKYVKAAFPCISNILIDPADIDHAFFYYEQGECEGYYRKKYSGGLVEMELDQESGWIVVPGRDESFSVAGMQLMGNGDLAFADLDGSIYEFPKGALVAEEPSIGLYSKCGFSDYDEVLDFIVLDDNKQILAAACGVGGLFVSLDGGANWEERHFSKIKYDENDFDVLVNLLVADPLDANRLVYAVRHITDTSTYLFEIKDVTRLSDSERGKPKAIDLPEYGLELLDVHVGGDAEYVCESEAGIFRRDRGAPEFIHSSQGIAAFDVNGIAFAPRADGSFAVTGGGGRENGNGGVYFWDVASSSWRRSAGWNVGVSTELAAYRGDEIWVTAKGGLNGGGLYSSIDGGLSWQFRSGSMGMGARHNVYGFQFSTSNNKVGLAGTSSGFYRTVDGGANWSVDLEFVYTGGWIVAEDVSGPMDFFAASGDFMYSVYLENGRAWKTSLVEVVNDPVMVSAIAASPRDGGHVLIGTRSNGLYERGVLVDGSWQRPLTRIPSGNVLSAAIADRKDDDWMAASIQGKGVYFIKDGSTRWEMLSEGLESFSGDLPRVNVLVFDPLAPRLIAGVENMGLYFLDFTDDIKIPEAYLFRVERIYKESGELIADIKISAQEFPMGAEMRFSSDGVAWGRWKQLAAEELLQLSAQIRTSQTVFAQFRDASGNASGVADENVKDLLPPLPSSASSGGGGGGGCFISMLSNIH